MEHILRMPRKVGAEKYRLKPAVLARCLIEDFFMQEEDARNAYYNKVIHRERQRMKLKKQKG